MPKLKDIKKVLVIGSGPIIIGNLLIRSLMHAYRSGSRVDAIKWH